MKKMRNVLNVPQNAKLAFQKQITVLFAWMKLINLPNVSVLMANIRILSVHFVKYVTKYARNVWKAHRIVLNAVKTD